MSLFKSLFSKSDVTSSISYEKDEMFEHILKLFFNFQKTVPDKIVSFDIYPSNKATGSIAFDLGFILDGKIDWYSSNEANELLEFFRMIEDDGGFQTFEYTYNTYKSSNNRKQIDDILKSNVRHFMLENPDKKFDLSSSGAKITY